MSVPTVEQLHAMLDASEEQHARYAAAAMARAVLGPRASAGDVIALAEWMQSGTARHARRGGKLRSRFAAAVAAVRGWLLVCWPPARGKVSVRRNRNGLWVLSRPAVRLFRGRSRQVFATHAEAVAAIADPVFRHPSARIAHAPSFA